MPDDAEVPYDELGEAAQAERRAEWERRIAARIAALDLEAEFRREGRSWSELDERGRLRRRT